MELTIKVICKDLPGGKFVDRQGAETTIREGIYLGIQRAEEVVEAAPGNRKMNTCDGRSEEEGESQ